MSTPQRLPVHCYHASPGSPDEFVPLARMLRGNELIGVLREGSRLWTHELKVAAAKPFEKPCIVLGYSWGALESLRAVASEPELVEGVVLVSPFLGSHWKGPLRERLASLIPYWGGYRRFQKASREVGCVVESLLGPQSACEHIEMLRRELSRPEILLEAWEEQRATGPSVGEACRVLGQASIPVWIVSGENDNYCLQSVHVELLKQWLPTAQTFQIERAGHAIPLTHTKELSEIVLDFMDELAGFPRDKAVV